MAKQILHITNGDCAAAVIQQTGLPGEVLPWRDMLHEGPVPGGLTPEELRQVRATYLAEVTDWITETEVLEFLTYRDQTLDCYSSYEEVILWFEHDLYDQLQLLQILDRLSQGVSNQPKLSLICIDRFAGVEPFYGLGQLNSEQMRSLHPNRKPISEIELSLGRQLWQAFCSPNPQELELCLNQDPGVLPFLHQALTRHLQQFPALSNGLSRTEQQILTALKRGDCAPAELFQRYQDQEEAPYMGDSPFWLYLRGLALGREPLISLAASGRFKLPEECPESSAFHHQILCLTPKGQEVLRGEADWLELNGIDRWLGGVQLCDSPWGRTARPQKPLWRWDQNQSKLVTQ